jgi:mRNA interferase MazF
MAVLQWAVIQANLNPVIGTEQQGVRPVLIISNEAYNQTMPNVTILPLTSTKRRLYPSEIQLPKGKAGQPLESIIMAHQIRTISKQRLGKLLGYLEDIQLRQEIYRAVKEHLDME